MFDIWKCLSNIFPVKSFQDSIIWNPVLFKKSSGLLNSRLEAKIKASHKADLIILTQQTIYINIQDFVWGLDLQQVPD